MNGDTPEEDPPVDEEKAEARTSEGEPQPGDPGEEAGEREGAESGDGQELPEQIREQLEELEELRDKHLRLAAEFDNYRKRTRREISSQQERAKAELAGRLLDVLDDLRRFNDAAQGQETDVGSLREGMELVEQKLRKELGDAGLERIEAAGEKFDPKQHEALTTTPVEDPERDGYISQVLVEGYTFGDQLLRPARVEVMKHREPEGGEGAGGDGDNEQG
ncbi:MAG: nucleotide exchange factor GrpE [Candidatus Palauibacterales bacterium]|nr:nucleotide exchange factor GrpE [Candidatus Palauibacterales bacterium]